MELRKPEFEGANDMMSAADLDANGPALGASRVGAELRAARLRLGWSLPDVAQELRIRLPYLEAIEDGRICRPARQRLRRRLPAHLCGGARPRCRRGGPPVPRRGAGSQPQARTELPRPGAGARRPRRRGRSCSAWCSPPAPTPPGIASPTTGAPTPASPRCPSAWPRSPSAQPRPHPPSRRKSPRSCRRRSRPRRAPASPPAGHDQRRRPPPLRPPRRASPGAVRRARARRPAPAQSAPPHQDPNRLVLKFKAGAYVQVREKQGQVLLNRVMRAGDTWPVPNEPGLLMTTGNAGGTEVVLDGITAAPLGAERRRAPRHLARAGCDKNAAGQQAIARVGASTVEASRVRPYLGARPSRGSR